MSNEALKNIQIVERKKLLIFFQELKKEISLEIDILELRPNLISNEHSYFEGDFDYLVKNGDIEKLLHIIYEKCKKEGINFELSQNKKSKKLFRFFRSSIEECSIAVEFWSQIEFSKNNQLNVFSSEDLFSSLKEKAITQNELLILLYITHLYHKKKDITTNENQYRFTYYKDTADKNKDKEIYTLLENLFKNRISFSKANKISLRILSAHGITKSNRIPVRYSKFFNAKLNRIFNLHRLIPIVGPDGSGKGSVALKSENEIKNLKPFRFKNLYRIKHLYRLIIKTYNSKGEEPKNKIDEKLGYYIFTSSFFMIRVLTILFRKQLILMDRYFIDYYGTPIRYPKNGEKPKKLKLYKLLLFLTPTPKKIIFLGCTNESLVSRKNELSITSVNFLQYLYYDFILKKSPYKVLFISTENTIPITSQVLMDFLKK